LHDLSQRPQIARRPRNARLYEKFPPTLGGAGLAAIDRLVVALIPTTMQMLGGIVRSGNLFSFDTFTRCSMRIVLSVICALALLGFATAEDKGKAVKLEGKICCAKCELGKESKCATVIVTQEKGKEVMYYFDADSNKKYHKEYCTGSSEAKVSGKVTEKDGKKMISIDKIDSK
jgi:hypothetical protein